jgi:hypothetical protein
LPVKQARDASGFGDHYMSERGKILKLARPFIYREEQYNKSEENKFKPSKIDVVPDINTVS